MTERPMFEEGSQIITVGNDKGKEVIINSVGGGIRNTHAKVIQGPYNLRYKTHTNVNKKNPDGRSKEVYTVTDPYWLVKLNENGFYLHFSKDELKFV